MQYETAQQYMNNARNRYNGRPLGERATRMYDRGTHFAIRYHNTDVVCIYPDGWELNSGGYHSVTTKKRINDYSPTYVYQRNWIWYVADSTEFHDYMFISLKGNVYNSRQDYLNTMLTVSMDESQEA